MPTRVRGTGTQPRDRFHAFLSMYKYVDVFRRMVAYGCMWIDLRGVC